MLGKQAGRVHLESEGAQQRKPVGAARVETGGDRSVGWWLQPLKWLEVPSCAAAGSLGRGYPDATLMGDCL